MSRAANDAWVWVPVPLIEAVHAEQLAEHGGAAGVRDAGLLASAMARPMQMAHYGVPDAAQLAAAYAFGLARNHPFIDGNKRAGFVAAQLFLRLNGHRINAPLVDCAMTMLQLAAGHMDESAYAEWLRHHLQPL